MKHMATGELIVFIGEAQRELAQRFGVELSAGSVPAPKSLTAPRVAPAQPARFMSLLTDGDGREFYSVCGNVVDCGCRYNIVPKTTNAERDRSQRPPIDDRVLYLHGLSGHPKEDEAYLRRLLATSNCKVTEIKVIRNRYAFLTFASHAEAAGAQRVLAVTGPFSVSFNRINGKRRQQQHRQASDHEQDECNDNEDVNGADPQ